MDNNEIQNAVVEHTQTVKHAASEMGDKMRALMEKSLHETRARYAKTKSAMEEASSAMEASYGAAREGVAQLNIKAIEALKSDAEANFAHLTSLASVKSISDMITLNTEFVRKRFEEATARAKTFSEMARKAADEAASPIRAQVAKKVKFAS